MRSGITTKLFFALFATCMLVVITMQWGVRVSFEHSFIHYIKRSNTQRISLLGNALAEQYALHGNWEFLHNNQRLVYQLLRSFEQSAEESRDLPPHGWRTQIWVLDSRQRKLVGPPGPPPREGPRYAIRAEGQIVGWLVSTPVELLTRNADITLIPNRAAPAGLSWPWPRYWRRPGLPPAVCWPRSNALLWRPTGWPPAIFRPGCRKVRAMSWAGWRGILIYWR